MNVNLEDSVKEMVGLLTKMEASLASRVSSIGDERMPSTQLFSRMELLAMRFGGIVEALQEATITRNEAREVASKLDSIHKELKVHTLVLESINAKVHDILNKPPAPTKRKR